MKLYHIIRRKDYLTGHPENFEIKLDFFQETLSF